ncbi:MAG: hypothetical protein LBD77_00555, partial [Bifidobacteriaceae bacterium]|nr:hypothetical protein [Bifidobacteriaceae bacterium]
MKTFAYSSPNELPNPTSRAKRLKAGAAARRRWRALVRAGAAAAAAALAGVAMIAPASPSDADARTFIMGETVYGPNEEVVLLSGAVGLGCDGLYRTSDVYVVSAGTVSGNGAQALIDESGSPNMIVSAGVASIFDSVTLGWTAPGGNIGPGTYDLVEDVCTDGVFDPGEDTILRDAFQVTAATPGVPVPPMTEMTAMKAAARQRLIDIDNKSMQLRWYVFLYGKVPGVPGWARDALWDGPKEIIKYFVKEVACVKAVEMSAIANTLWGTAAVKGCQEIMDKAPWDEIDDGVSPSEAVQSLVDHQTRLYQQIADDPPDPDFAEPVSLAESPVYTAVGNQLDRAFQEFFAAEFAEAAAAEAVLHALEKYQGAEAGAAPVAALAQAKSVSTYARQVIAALAAQAAARQSLMAFDEAADGMVKAELVTAYNELHSRLKAGGSLTADESGVLADYGLGQEAVAEFVQSVIDDESLAEPVTSLAAIDADALVSERAMVDALKDLADAFDAIAAQLEQDLAAARISSYPTVALSGPATAVIGEAVTVTATTNPANNLAWDTDADGEFDDGTGATASATMAHLGLNSVGVLVTDAVGRQTVEYHLVTVAYPASHPLIAAASHEGETSIKVDDAEAVTLEVTPGHTDGSAVTVTWYVNGEARATGDSIEVAGDRDVPIQRVEARVTSADGLSEVASWDVETLRPMSEPSLVADFGSVGVSGLVDVAWDRVGGSVVGASSVYSSGYGAG